MKPELLTKKETVIPAVEGTTVVPTARCTQPAACDVLLPAPESVTPGKIRINGESVVMSAADESFIRKELQAEDDEDISIVSVLGKIAVLVTRANTISRQIQWDQTTETMQLAVKFAPIIAQCVQLNWEHQAEATKIEGEKEITSGRMMTLAGVGGMVTGAMKYKSEVEEAAKKESAVALKEAKAAGQEAEAAELARQSAEAAGAKGWGTKLKEFFTKGVGLKHVMKGAFKSLETSLGLMQGSAALSKWTVEGPADINASNEKRIIGQFEAASKSGDGFMAYWNSTTQRSSETTTAADRNHSETLQTYKTASDTITNVLVSAYGKV